MFVSTLPVVAICFRSLELTSLSYDCFSMYLLYYVYMVNKDYADHDICSSQHWTLAVQSYTCHGDTNCTYPRKFHSDPTHLYGGFFPSPAVIVNNFPSFIHNQWLVQVSTSALKWIWVADSWVQLFCVVGMDWNGMWKQLLTDSFLSAQLQRCTVRCVFVSARIARDIFPSPQIQLHPHPWAAV